jgi:hypothetical protein
MYSPKRVQFKIGHGDPVERLASLKTGCPDIKFCAGVITGSPYAIEQRIHAHFRDERDGTSEWFEDSSRLRKWVDGFASQPNTQTDIFKVKDTQGTHDLWPWYKGPSSDELGDENGHIPLFTDSILYVQRTGHGKGQTSSQSEDWYTHEDVVKLTRDLFNGTIDLDPMSCHEANLVVKAEKIYTAEVNGLLFPWRGHILWNPPWGGADANSVKRRGVKKLLDSFRSGEVEEAICVLNANAVTTSWFAPLLAFPICIPPRRIEHHGPGGKGGAPNSGTVIVYVGPSPSRFSQVFSSLGRIMVPYEGDR